MARGYLNLPEMTASRFLDDPFSHLAAQRMYRTGDLGRWLPDGNIEYLGRNDFQVKIRGFRIEPGEIEACLTACDDVREAVVIAREDVPGDRRLVAYLIPEDGCVPEPAALRLQLSRSLAEYMLPAAFVVVSTFPLTPNGKLDRRALPAPDQSAVASRGYAAPLGDTETALAAVWCELLGVTQVGRHDNFFELGGHSLMAVKLLTQMSRAGLKTTLPTLYKNSTLCQLAEAIDKPRDIAISLLEDNPIPLKLSGNEAPLFLLHEPSGDPLVYSALAEKLNLNRPVYALQAIGLHTLTPSPATLEELGNYHLQAIRKVQSSGPYYLAGWSLGGVLSYEIATQLAKMGEKVAYIGMIDSYNPNFIKNNTLGKSYENSIKDEMILRFVNKFVPNNQKHILCECSRPIDAKKIFDLGLHHQWFPSKFSFDDLMLRLNTALYLRTLGLNYVPIYSGLNVDIYIAEDGGEKDLWRGWQQLIGIESSIHIIGGTHDSIMQMPLLESLAKKMSSKLSPYENYNPLVRLSDGIVGEPPIFCIPGAGASAISFFEFANAILYKGPVYAFQARGLDDSNIKPYQTIQETATDYIKAMVKNYPSGPYRLIGHSFGGWIAFEMALQLHASGKVVSEVVILDSRAPGVRIEEDKLLGSTDTIIKLINIYNLTLEEPLPINGDEIINLEKREQVNLLYKALIQCGVFTKKTPISSLERILDVMQKNINTHYSPSSSYSGKVLLINAKDSDIKARKRNEKHWKKYAYKLELMKSDGNHMTMLKKPNITSLIRMLRDVYS
ncbi:hypothetical protein ACO03_17490 [Pantoea ananatis]|nr:hypothetical protein ACO03_17490 [Pantoea ananatis]